MKKKRVPEEMKKCIFCGMIDNDIAGWFIGYTWNKCICRTCIYDLKYCLENAPPLPAYGDGRKK